MDSSSDPFSPEAPARAWRWRRALHGYSQRLGLQAKLLISFVGLLVLGLTASCIVFIGESRARLDDVMGEQARQMAYALSLTSKPAMIARNGDELSQIGRDLLKTRNILFVAFFDRDFKPIAVAHRDPDFNPASMGALMATTRTLMQVRQLGSKLLGDYLQVSAPVLAVGEAAGTGSEASAGGARLLGYVTVGIGQAPEEAQLLRVNSMTLMIGAIIALSSVPIAVALVHRIFYPIRQLVAATNEIAAGKLDTRVEIGRPDLIGSLARAFNEMVLTVRRQRDDLASANRGLEEKIQARTRQLESANRRLSNEIAEKEDFLRAISHDLGAPLRNIGGMAAMLLAKYRDGFDPDVIHRLERIQQNVAVEGDLISELLELSRIKTRRQKREPVDVTQMITNLAGVFESDLKGKNIDLRVETKLPILICERARIRQVFQNLIDNAIKYMGDVSERQIAIGCRVDPDEAEFYVRDTGIGIDPEDQASIFFVFRRGKNPTTRNIAGKGVGLASVKSIVETYDGTIGVESEPGHGSTFRFTINAKYIAPQSLPVSAGLPEVASSGSRRAEIGPGSSDPRPPVSSPPRPTANAA